MPVKKGQPVSREDRYLNRWYDSRTSAPADTGEVVVRSNSDTELQQMLDDMQEQARKKYEQDADKREKEEGRLEQLAAARAEQATKEEELLHKRVEKAKLEAEQEAEGKKGDPYLEQQKKKAERDAERKAKQDSFNDWIADKFKGAVNSASNAAGKAAYNISQWHTPGGVSLLIILLLVLAATVVVVNGNNDTRIKQWWYMLSGRADLSGSVTPTMPPYQYMDQFQANIGLNLLPNLPISLPGTVQTAVAVQQAGTGNIAPLEQLLGQWGNSIGSQFRNQFGGLP